MKFQHRTRRGIQRCFPVSWILDILYDDSFHEAPLISICLNVLFACLLSLLPGNEESDGSLLLEQGLRMSSLVSTAAITIVTLTFSLTVLSVQIAAGNYSPRLLEDFLKDPQGKIVISINLGAYAYCFTLFYFMNDENDAPYVAIHGLSVQMTLILLSFVNYIQAFLKAMRLDEILLRAAAASMRAAKTLSKGSRSSTNSSIEMLDIVPEHAYKVLADKSGYITKLLFEHVIDKAYALDVCVRYRHYIGDFVTEGTILCLIWDAKTRSFESTFEDRIEGFISSRSCDQFQDERSDRHVEKKLGILANKGVRISDRRDSDYDVTLGIQQLVDTAVRALSAAVNDPQTAIQCMDVLSPLMVELADMELGVPHAVDKDDFVRICSPRRSFSFLLCMLDPIRRYGGGDLSVCRRSLRFFGDIAAALSRSDRLDRIPAALLQMDEWIRVARANFTEGSAESYSLVELYCHIMESIAKSDSMVTGSGHFDTVRDSEDFETLLLRSDTPAGGEERLLTKAKAAHIHIKKAIKSSLKLIPETEEVQH